MSVDLNNLQRIIRVPRYCNVETKALSLPRHLWSKLRCVNCREWCVIWNNPSKRLIAEGWCPLCVECTDTIKRSRVLIKDPAIHNEITDALQTVKGNN